MQHDGQRFTIADVFGLCSVGLSIKRGRTIGFMGIGFKAVSKRFRRVRVADRTWSFSFEAPSPEEDNHRLELGWMVLPRWVEADTERGRNFQCRFDLEQPLGGLAEVREDLARLWDEVPPLLGRRVLPELASRERPIKSWQLDWGDRRLEVSRISTAEASGVELIAVEEKGARRDWCFVSESVHPSPAALDDYRAVRGQQAEDPGRQEICLFFEICGGKVTTPGNGGKIFNVLPTKLESRMGYHLQANWLPSMDRQDIEELRSSAWNLQLADRLPLLVIRLLRWIASGDGPSDPRTAYKLMPVPAGLRHVQTPRPADPF